MKYTYRVAGRDVELESDDDFIAVRFIEPALHSTRARVSAENGLGAFGERIEVPEESYTVLPVAPAAEARDVRCAKAMRGLGASNDVARAAPVFRRRGVRIFATERVLVGAKPGAKLQKAFDAHGCTILRERDGEFVLQLGPQADPLEVASSLARDPGVAYAEPDFVTIGSHLQRSPRARSTPGPSSDAESGKQYAIRITEAVNAWELQRGDPSVRIAVLDEGVDTAHEDLAAAIVDSFDSVDGDSFQEPNPWDGHGTACAGLAAAVHDNVVGIKGIGGGCSLMAARIAYSRQDGANWTTSNSWIANAADWAWEHGASVLSNSWGGGTPSNAIINAFERARTGGRGGKGCVIVVAAGNDSSSVDFPGNLPNVLTVSASNEFDQFKTKTSGDGETWWGSNFGPEVDVAAPGVHNWTTDVTGSSGYTPGHYTDFNGTSSATPIVAGACGLILSANPDLTEAEVRAIVRSSADKVGSQPYVNGRNDQFGNGRLNCRAAIEAARPRQATHKAIHRAIETVPILDNSTSRLSVAVGDTRSIRGVEVQVEIEHTYIGDLNVMLNPPAHLGAQPVQLHGGTGGSADDIKRVFDKQTTPALAQLEGRSLPGEWTLEVTDSANRDEGAILSFGVELSL